MFLNTLQEEQRKLEQAEECAEDEGRELPAEPPRPVKPATVWCELPADPPRPQDVEPGKSRYDYRICVVSYKIINFWLFNHFILLLIVLNTIALATDAHPAPAFSN